MIELRPQDPDVTKPTCSSQENSHHLCGKGLGVLCPGVSKPDGCVFSLNCTMCDKDQGFSLREREQELEQKGGAEGEREKQTRH